MSFFDASKLFWLFCAPTDLILGLAIETAILLVAGRPRAGRALAVATAVSFSVLGLLPVGDWMLKPLEDQYPRPDPAPARVDGIVTLGGGLGANTVASRGALDPEPSLSRVVETYALARRYPGARVVYSGGGQLIADAAAAKVVFDKLGLPAARLTLETRSRNTFENLLFTRDLVHPRPGATWLLATSAFHMPRAMAVAERLGWKMTPWPTDYMTKRTPTSMLKLPGVAINLSRTDLAAKEWIGLAVYRFEGMASARAS